MYRSPTTDNIISTTKQLFAKHIKELNNNAADPSITLQFLDAVRSQPGITDVEIQQLNAIELTAKALNDPAAIDIFFQNLVGPDYQNKFKNDPIGTLNNNLDLNKAYHAAVLQKNGIPITLPTQQTSSSSSSSSSSSISSVPSAPQPVSQPSGPPTLYDDVNLSYNDYDKTIESIKQLKG
eukprot:CAMPEP_0174819642 /NCGR_PEP_ID=MMETSP1107-20130205/3003_1 /TAXON_ID=36770 /ORGANISM="Paraphysomonas vestita, Strain GFlagA" /LENGTH=179 /DNA_ID=CAMNT_0016033533 /DNA_START=99 /DNA_END=635 /DNA_ORIENTATION=+